MQTRLFKGLEDRLLTEVPWEAVCGNRLFRCSRVMGGDSIHLVLKDVFASAEGTGASLQHLYISLS
jgi:hypothetical protein